MGVRSRTRILFLDKADMEKARWVRKTLGVGMSQAGVLAACGLYNVLKSEGASASFISYRPLMWQTE